MNKLFILNASSSADYSKELMEALNVVEGALQLDISELSIDYLKNNKIDLVISNGLPSEWYYICKGLKIVSVTIDCIKEYYDQADIVIDYKNDSDRRYLTGKNYSIINNEYFDIHEIVDLIKKLNWDSEFFGFPIAYLSSKYLSDSIAFRINKYIKSNNIKLVQYLCNCHDYSSVQAAESNQFHFVDIRLTFEKKMREKQTVNLPTGHYFGKAEPRHIDKLKDIAQSLYIDSRYYYDKSFDVGKLNEFYQGWVEKAVYGKFDDECYCIFQQDEPLGFCTIRYNKAKTANISLFGIDKNYQGLGIGKNIILSVFNTLIVKEINTLFVVTQGRNYPAQRLYQSAGFVTTSTELWYHKWI